MEQRIDISTNIIFRVVSVVAVAWFLYVIRDVIALFLVSIIITAALYPIIGKVEKLLTIPRAFAVSVVYILFFTMIGLLAAFIVPTLSAQFEQFTNDLTLFVQQHDALAQNFSSEDLGQRLAGSLGNLFSTTVGFLTGLISVVAVISMSFYMSLQKDGLKIALLSITPAQHQKYISSLIDRIQESFGRWMAGQLVTMIFVGVLYYVVLALLGVPYAPLLALLGGLLEIIPYFGPILSAIPAIAIGFSDGTFVIIMIVVGYIVINVIENQVLIPKIMNKAVGLNPVLVILALLMGAKIAGIIGLFLAVPVAGALGLFLKDIFEKRIK